MKRTIVSVDDRHLTDYAATGETSFPEIIARELNSFIKPRDTFNTKHASYGTIIYLILAKNKGVKNNFEK